MQVSVLCEENEETKRCSTDLKRTSLQKSTEIPTLTQRPRQPTQLWCIHPGLFRQPQWIQTNGLILRAAPGCVKPVPASEEMLAKKTLPYLHAQHGLFRLPTTKIRRVCVLPKKTGRTWHCAHWQSASDILHAGKICTHLRLPWAAATWEHPGNDGRGLVGNPWPARRPQKLNQRLLEKELHIWLYDYILVSGVSPASYRRIILDYDIESCYRRKKQLLLVFLSSTPLDAPSEPRPKTLSQAWHMSIVCAQHVTVSCKHNICIIWIFIEL